MTASLSLREKGRQTSERGVSFDGFLKKKMFDACLIFTLRVNIQRKLPTRLHCYTFPIIYSLCVYLFL